MITYDYNSDVLLDFDENFPWTYDHLFQSMNQSMTLLTWESL